jgi:hypothetical protein
VFGRSLLRLSSRQMRRARITASESFGSGLTCRRTSMSRRLAEPVFGLFAPEPDSNERRVVTSPRPCSCASGFERQSRAICGLYRHKLSTSSTTHAAHRTWRISQLFRGEAVSATPAPDPNSGPHRQPPRPSRLSRAQQLTLNVWRHASAAVGRRVMPDDVLAHVRDPGCARCAS